MGYSITEHFENAEPQKRRGLSANVLLAVMAILMLLDHCYYYLPNMPAAFCWLGRLVVPTLFFLMVEGFYHTESVTGYLLRMYGFAAATSFGNFILHHATGMQSAVDHNIFWSLALGLSVVCVLEHIRTHKAYRTYLIYLPAVIFLCAFMIMTEATVYGIFFTLIFYFCRRKKVLMSILYLSVTLITTLGLAFQPITVEYLLQWDPQWMMAFALVPILLYNGERGKIGTGLLYGYYSFYPVHLWLIYIFKYLIR